MKCDNGVAKGLGARIRLRSEKRHTVANDIHLWRELNFLFACILVAFCVGLVVFV